MCIGRRPSPPKLPDPEPLDSAIEQTADKVVLASNRSNPESKMRRKLSSQTGRGRLGTQSLQIPLLTNSTNTGNLNY